VRRVYLQVRPFGGQTLPRQAIVFFVEGEAVDEAPASIAAIDDKLAADTVRRLAEELRLRRPSDVARTSC
jgi:hypothetical protein